MRVFKKLIAVILKIFYKTPFYPYFLVFENERKTNEDILRKFAKGKIVDIGCGSCNYKAFCLSLNNVSSYFGVEYPGWLNNFNKAHAVSKQFGVIGDVLLRSSPLQVQIWADGTELGIKTGSVDTVVSFGVLEHIANPDKYISEVARILKKEGYFILTIPFLYESHGGQDCQDDFWRWTKHGIILELKKHDFNNIDIFTYGRVGTMFSQLINSYLVKKIKFWNTQENIYFKSLKALCLLPVFFIVNLLCWILNGIDADHAYAAGFYAVAKK